MTRSMTATEAKVRLLSLLNEVKGGEEIEITKHGRVVARLVPPHGSRMLKGRLRRLAMTCSDEDDLLSADLRWEIETLDRS